MSDENPLGILCERCGKKVATIYAVNPYLQELYPEDIKEEEWWCEECYQESLDNI